MALGSDLVAVVEQRLDLAPVSSGIVVENELLHTLRLVGSSLDTGGSVSDSIVASGFALRRKDRLLLTPSGRVAAEEAARLPVGGEDEAAARRVYEGFLPLNIEFLRACTEWQVHPGGAANDHTDSVYDWAVIDRVVAIVERVEVPVSRLGRRVERFSAYKKRMSDALKLVEDGEHDWLVSPRIDSLHTVWMQLHEDLLLALGIARGDEAGA